jgi:putative N6-adenine-specific DNA methylase
MAKNIAPGLNRTFVSEGWPQIDKTIWEDARQEAGAAIYQGIGIAPIFASDINEDLINQAIDNAKKAGVADLIRFTVADISKIKIPGEYGEYGILMTNPPYGERLGDKKDLPKIYAALKRLIPATSTWSAYIITSDETLEQHLNRKAAAKRKLYSGALKTDYYQFHGPKTPRTNK